MNVSRRDEDSRRGVFAKLEQEELSIFGDASVPHAVEENTPNVIYTMRTHDFASPSKIQPSKHPSSTFSPGVWRKADLRSKVESSSARSIDAFSRPPSGTWHGTRDCEAYTLQQTHKHVENYA